MFIKHWILVISSGNFKAKNEGEIQTFNGAIPKIILRICVLCCIGGKKSLK